jgi:hypothetical protein
MIVFELMLTLLAVDFVSGLLHWAEDAYGGEKWPITGQLITKPNILHHHDPRYFTRHGWFHSSWLLLCIGIVIVVGAWICGLLTWHVWLFVALGINANQIHKWAHRSPAENGRVISLLQHLRIVQTARHHARHHSDPKNTHYCVITNFLNPILDKIGFWGALEIIILRSFGIRRRMDTSIVTGKGQS